MPGLPPSSLTLIGTLKYVPKYCRLKFNLVLKISGIVKSAVCSGSAVRLKQTSVC